MKKYKHKIIAGVTAEFSDRAGMYFIDYPKLKDKFDNSMFLIKELVENSNEWEEIKEEPNYLITAFRDLRQSSLGSLYKLGSNGVYSTCARSIGPDARHMLEVGNCVNNGAFEIYSVKNSKGEEFFLNEQIDTICGKFNINKFSIVESLIILDLVSPDRGKGTIGLEHVIKSKKPIFVSADGKEMKRDDVIYVLTDNGNQWQSELSCIIQCLKKDYKYFSSEKARQEYIDNNKPKYSMKDIELLLDKAYPVTARNLLDSLKKLGK